MGLRLREERKRLGFTQDAMAAACGSSKRTQILFEQDVHVPNGAYFAAAYKLGADVSYLLVGARERLSAPDAELLDAWRFASAPARTAAMTALVGGTSHAAELALLAEFNDATMGQQFSGDVDLRGQWVIVKTPGREKASRP